MPVPDFQSLMLPTLKSLWGGGETPNSEIRARIATAEGLKREDMQEMLPSGRQTVYTNRVSWAIYHMERARLLERVRRSVYQLTEEGKRLLSREPSRIDMKLLREYPVYVEWSKRMKATQLGKESMPTGDDSIKDTPEEALIRAASELRSALEAVVLDRVCSAESDFLEQVVVDLLIAMGYGRGDAKAGRVTGRSGDGGIDGTIREDALGLDEVYVQTKRFADGNTVGEGALRNFAGAIDAAGTTKGVFVTTSCFTKSAKKYVALSPKRIVLIDGYELAKLMVEYNIGVRVRDRYDIKRIDESFFDQDDI